MCGKLQKDCEQANLLHSDTSSLGSMSLGLAVGFRAVCCSRLHLG